MCYVLCNWGFTNPLFSYMMINTMSIFTFIFSNPFFIIISILILLLLAGNIFLQWQNWQLKKKFKLLFNGQRASNLEGVIFEQIKRLRLAEKNIIALKRFDQYLEKMALSSIQKVGVIRFNPFRDTGGDQSFSIAILDANDNGLVLSSLFTREGTRIYTKPLQNGQSKYPLSKEEMEAIKRAKARKS